MNTILNQIYSPAFLHGVVVLACAFSLVVGVALVSRNATALRLIAAMNRWVSLRQMMKPLTQPHHVEPVLLRRPVILGLFIILGATISVVVLRDIDAKVFEAVFLAFLTSGSALELANAIKWFLLIGNGLCGLVGLMMLFSPRRLTAMEAYADKWYSLRKKTYPLDIMHYEVDNWVMAHPTLAGAILIVMSLGLGVSLYGPI